MAVEKCQGLKKGEKAVKICELVCISNVTEYLGGILGNNIREGQSEVEREGFPDLTSDEFVIMFCKMNKCDLLTPVNRIEFDYL